MCFENDYGKDAREVKARREAIAEREAEKVASEKNRYLKLDEDLKRIAELPKEEYDRLYEQAKAFLIEKAGTWNEIFMGKEIIERIMTGYLNPKEDEVE